MDINKLLTNATKEELVELLKLTENWRGDKEHKFYLYQANPVPYYFHKSMAKTRALFGGNRSSKTYSTMIDYASQFKGEVPKTMEGVIPQHRIDMFRRNRLCMNDYPNSFLKVIWPYVQQLIPSDDISDVIKDSGRVKAIVNKQGGFLEFMQYDQDVSKFQGSSRHSIGYDEVPPQSIRDENMMRLVDTDGEETFSLTPTSEANSGASDRWLLDEIADKASTTFELENGQIIQRTNPEGDKDVEVFFADIYDNVAIGKEAADRILSKYSDDERLMRQKGKFMFFAGLVYKEFNDQVHLIPPINNWWEGNKYTIYVAIDPHPRTPHAVLFMAVDQYNTLFLVDELFIETKTSRELVEAIQAKLMGKIPELIIIDPIANTPDPINGACLAWDIAEQGLYPVPIAASKDKSRGIIMVRSALSFKERTLYICRNLVRTRFEITHYVWDAYTKDNSNKHGVKQKPVDKDDHMMENLYRLCLLNPLWIEEYEQTSEYTSQQQKRKLGRSYVTGY